MHPTIEIWSVKALCMQLRQQVPGCETVGIFLTGNARGKEEWAYLDDALLLDIHDTTNAHDPMAFLPEHGDRVLDFLQRNETCGRICVCCDSGQSRSTAMAAAIMRYFGQDDLSVWEDPHYHPNLLVYERQMAAFGMAVSKERLAQLKAISDDALSSAIRRSREGMCRL